MNKKLYISPHISFEDIEAESSLCDISVYAPDQPGTDLEESKRSDFIFDNNLVGPIEEANNNFEYSIDFDF